MSDETIRALERELRRQGEDVMVLRAKGGSLPRASKGFCFMCRASSEAHDVRELSGPGQMWTRLCRSCIELVVAQAVDPQSVATLQPSKDGGAIYIRVEERT